MSVVADPTLKIPQNDNADLASLLPDRIDGNFNFRREDWHMFRSINGLPQKAGVPLRWMRRLVLKELVDNALDAGRNVTMQQEDETYIIEDDGPGIDGGPEYIAQLFSIARPLMSSKMWRLPTRGALGNGLRVAVGAVLVSHGTLIVTTRNQRHVLTPRDDGATSVDTMPAMMPTGTRIEIRFGSALPRDPFATSWGLRAIAAAVGDSYTGKSSPFWYDPDHFFDLLRAAERRPVRALVEELDGCSGAKAGAIAAEYRGRPCMTMDRDEAISLLGVARAHAKPVKPARLGSIGPDAFDGAYVIARAEVEIGARKPKAIVPFVVEVWAELSNPKEDGIAVDVLVNRTPVAAVVEGYKNKKDITIHGCGLGHRFETERGYYEMRISIISPVVPITTDGKEPDLLPFLSTIIDTATKAVRKAKRAVPKTSFRQRSHKEITLSVLDEAIAKASGDGQFVFNQRQLFYAVRPYIIEELGVEPTYGNFCAILTGYEEECGEIEGMHRDPRGIIYHPHSGTEIPLGTKSVSNYSRPPWTFNKVLFIEKEGFFETLKAVKWPERYDCALMSSKGFSSRAARDFLDMLAEDAVEDVTVFCVHDADAFGTMIYQTLQEATRARARRKVEIINLGLEPWEGEQMGLTAEDRDGEKKRAPVADYVLAHEDGEHWADWLQEKRYELNAMTMPQFIAWLDGKMAEHGIEKVIPPTDYVEETLHDDTVNTMRRKIETQILAEANVNEKVMAAMVDIVIPDAREIEDDLPEWLVDNPTDRWKGWVDEKVTEITGGRT